jgi:hypothetical protein
MYRQTTASNRTTYITHTWRQDFFAGKKIVGFFLHVLFFNRQNTITNNIMSPRRMVCVKKGRHMVTRSMVGGKKRTRTIAAAVVTPDPDDETSNSKAECNNSSSSSTSVWGSDTELQSEPVTKLEQNYMRFLCIKRRLPDHYSKIPLQLWSRVKGRYKIEDYHQQLLIALHVALKWDSQDLSLVLTCVRCAELDWPGLTKEKLLTHELQMCKALNWRFR